MPNSVRTNKSCLVLDAALMVGTSCDRQNSAKSSFAAAKLMLAPASSASFALTNAIIAASRSAGRHSASLLDEVASAPITPLAPPLAPPSSVESSLPSMEGCSGGAPPLDVGCASSGPEFVSEGELSSSVVVSSTFLAKSLSLTHWIDVLSMRLHIPSTSCSQLSSSPANTHPICALSVVVTIVHIMASRSPSNVSLPTSSHLLNPASHMAALIAFSVSSMESHGSTTKISEPRG